MEGNSFQTSFIPKKPIIDGSVRPAHSSSLFSLIAGVIFGTVVVLAVAVWGYHYFIKKSIENTKRELRIEIDSFSPALVGELSRLDTRIEAAKVILRSHLALSNFFTFLGDTTLKNVRYTSFVYSANGKSPQVTLSGQAQNFSAIALQADEFAKPDNQRYVQNSSFTNLNLDKSGNVVFTVNSMLNPGAYSYGDTLKASAISTATASSTAATATTTASTSKPR